VSLKQPFLITDLVALEAYFDQLPRSIAPLPLSFPCLGGPAAAPILWLEVEETETLWQLHIRINQELAERFQETQAPFDGPAYHFHLTIALGGAASAMYQSIAAGLASQYIALQTIARHLALFYFDDDQISPGSFLTYKILPLVHNQGSLSGIER
jgi:2'-5' RNA ligase